MGVLKLAPELVNMQYKNTKNESSLKHGYHLAWILLGVTIIGFGKSYSNCGREIPDKDTI
jgi:hypothetical protein